MGPAHGMIVFYVENLTKGDPHMKKFKRRKIEKRNKERRIKEEFTTKWDPPWARFPRWMTSRGGTTFVAKQEILLFRRFEISKFKRSFKFGRIWRLTREQGKTSIFKFWNSKIQKRSQKFKKFKFWISKRKNTFQTWKDSNQGGFDQEKIDGQDRVEIFAKMEGESR